MSQENIVNQSFKDLKQDFEELFYLFHSSTTHLQTCLQDLEKQKKNIQETSYLFMENRLRTFIDKNLQIETKLKQFFQLIQTRQLPLRKIIEEKRVFFELYRTRISILNGLITASDWQSPSYNHSLYSMAGKQTGKIIETKNDYKRDRHLDENSYQIKFIKEYTQGLFKGFSFSLLTSNGMSAFSTVLLYLLGHKKIKGSVLIGKSIYFENKELVKRLCSTVYEVDENKTDAIISILKIKKPSVIILDSLSNSSQIVMPDVEKIISYLNTQYKSEIYLLLDNTCLSIAFKPSQLTQAKHVHVITIESLNKYHQFGTDRVTAGIIYLKSPIKDLDDIYHIRDHIGANIIDSSIYSLPIPNNTMLVKRLARLERNTNYLATAIQEYVKENSKSSIETICYPLLKQHASYKVARNLSFHGSFFTFQFKKKYKTVKYYQQFIKAVLKEASKNKVQIVAGTSFGFNTSRIYLTSLETDYGEPFVRFSVGTESMSEIEALKNVMIKVISNSTK